MIKAKRSLFPIKISRRTASLLFLIFATFSDTGISRLTSSGSGKRRKIFITVSSNLIVFHDTIEKERCQAKKHYENEKKCVKIRLSLRKNRESWVKSRKNE